MTILNRFSSLKLTHAHFYENNSTIHRYEPLTYSIKGNLQGGGNKLAMQI